MVYIIVYISQLKSCQKEKRRYKSTRKKRKKCTRFWLVQKWNEVSKYKESRVKSKKKMYQEKDVKKKENSHKDKPNHLNRKVEMLQKIMVEE